MNIEKGMHKCPYLSLNLPFCVFTVAVFPRSEPQINSTKTIGNKCLTSVPLSRNNFISKGGVTYTKKAKLPNNKLCGCIFSHNLNFV